MQEGRPTLAWVVGVLVVGVVGMVAGFVIATVAYRGSSSDNDWVGLGAGLLGLFVATLVMVVGWLVLLVVVVRRYLPPGRRLGAAWASIGLVVAGGIVVGLLAQTSLGSGYGWAGATVQAVLLVGAIAPPVVVNVIRRRAAVSDATAAGEASAPR